MSATTRLAAARPAGVSFVAVALTTLAGLSLAHLALGAVHLPPRAIGAALLMRAEDPAHELILWRLRAPRLAAVLLCGAMLGLAGAILQGLARNPLADPGLTGVAPGAVLALAAASVAGVDPVGFAPSMLGAAGGLAVGGLVLALADPGRTGAGNRLLLIGVLIGGACGAMTGALLLFADEAALRDVLFWSVGSTQGRVWDHVAAMAPVAVAGGLLTVASARVANALALGDDGAAALGLRPVPARAGLLAVAAILTAGSVSVIGGVGFVGLIAPHAARRIVGGDARDVFPASAAVGALLLCMADLVARVAEIGWLADFAGVNLPGASGLPVGAVMAILGAPFFLYLLLRETRA